jgi:predicted metalloprotease
MRWTPGGESPDIEDRRNESPGNAGTGGGFGGFGGMMLASVVGRRFGIGGLIALFAITFVFRHFFESAPANPSQYSSPANSADRSVGGGQSDNKQIQFVSFVLDDAQKTWGKVLPEEAGVPYRHAKLVLFRDYTVSGCGAAQSATGPFYCPADEKVYLDLGFFDELSNRMGAPGEFAQAYVIAHELGHHVQKLLGIESKMRQLQQRNPTQTNPLSVRFELQADCFAGVWGHSTEQRNLIDQSDIESGMGAAAAVGDDRIQKMARGYVSPESFTHGSSAERTQWFRRGLESGDIASCNTFAQ